MSPGQGESITTEWDRHVDGCLYCGRPGPYSDEHVVSAGLGGDDRAWMLKGCICRICNSDVFSRQETKLLKQGPAALARLFLQPSTRYRNQPPSMDTESTLLLAPDNVWMVAELRAGGEPVVVPQVTLDYTPTEERFATAAPDVPAQEKLRSAVLDLAGADFPLIIKHAPRQFALIPLRWRHDHYEPGEEETASSPPAHGVWLGSLTAPKEPADAVVPWSLYLRSKGQLVCNCPGVQDAIAFLGRLRAVHARLFVEPGSTPAPLAIDRPQMFLRLGVDPDTDARVQTKIGLNLLAHLVDHKFVRRRGFDKAVAYVLSKDSQRLRQGQMPHGVGPPLENHHIFILEARRKKANGPLHVVFISQLYGGLPTVLELGSFKTVPPALYSPIVVQVDYTNHTIRRRTLMEHAADLLAQFQDP